MRNSFADRVFFCNSGAEANEGAIKFARKWGKDVDPSGNKFRLVSFKGGFHGRTICALSCTANPKYQVRFEATELRESSGLERTGQGRRPR